MIALLLASTILASVPAAVDKTLQEQPLELLTRQEFDVWTARVIRNEEIRDDLVGCAVERLMWTGGDLLTTGLSWENCPECKESNPAGVNADARAGLKFGQLGIDLGACLFEAKHKKNTGKVGVVVKLTSWLSRGGRAAIIANNLYAVFTGNALVKWGQSR